MAERPSPALYGVDYDPGMVSAIAACTGAIARLDARNSVTLMASAWASRAAWSGYARALQLQSAEVEEIDVFSWTCGLRLPGRPLHSTVIDLSDRFSGWTQAIAEPDPFAWRDGLPVAIREPEGANQHPALIRALDRVRQHARIDASLLPWLGTPFALRDMGLTTTPLACLAGGVKAFRLKARPNRDDWLALIRALEVAARRGVQRLDNLERFHRDAQRAIAAEFRPGTLPRLLALTMHRPLVSPQSVANDLQLSVAGASKLLERAAASELLVEITQRRSWRLFLVRDIAIEFGYISPARGRPRNEPPPLPASRNLTELFEAFDAEMEAVDRLLSARSG